MLTPLKLLVQLISQSATFQAAIGASSAAEAIERIHHPLLRNADTLDDITGTLAVVWLEGFAMARADQYHLLPECRLALLLRDDDRHPERPDIANIDFLSFAGRVLSDIATAAFVSDEILPIRRIEMVGRPVAGPEKQGQAAPYWYAVFELSIGK